MGIPGFAAGLFLRWLCGSGVAEKSQWLFCRRAVVWLSVRNSSGRFKFLNPANAPASPAASGVGSPWRRCGFYYGERNNAGVWKGRMWLGAGYVLFFVFWFLFVFGRTVGSNLQDPRCCKKTGGIFILLEVKV